MLFLRMFAKHSDRHIARVVFAITLEGSAQKLVTVRSALVLINHLESMLDVKLENSDAQLGGKCMCVYIVTLRHCDDLVMPESDVVLQNVPNDLRVLRRRSFLNTARIEVATRV